MTDRLDEDRRSIDEIDAKMAALFEERFKIVADVIDYKIENCIPILDSGREAEITEKNCSRIMNDDIRFYYRQYFKEMLRLSKEYQKQIQDEK
jgi:monofunctional chorismate mutase